MSPVGCHVEQQRSSLTTPDYREPPKFGPGPSKWHSSWQMPGTACGKKSTESLKLQPGHWGNGCFFKHISNMYLMVSHGISWSHGISISFCSDWRSGLPGTTSLGFWISFRKVMSWGAQWRLLWSIGNSWQLMSITFNNFTIPKKNDDQNAKLWTSVGPGRQAWAVTTWSAPAWSGKSEHLKVTMKSPWNPQAVAIAISEVSVSPRWNSGCSVSDCLSPSDFL